MNEANTYIPGAAQQFNLSLRAIEDFYERVDQDGPLPDQSNPHYKGLGKCWTWTGSKNTHGYGFLNIEKKPRKAHRVSYFIANGEFDYSLDVLHKCDNPACVNPDHLWLGDDCLNRIDSIKKGRSNPCKGERNKGGGKLTEEKVRKIRGRSASGEPQRDIAADFMISQALVSLIHRRQSWSHVL